MADLALRNRIKDISIAADRQVLLLYLDQLEGEIDRAGQVMLDPGSPASVLLLGGPPGSTASNAALGWERDGLSYLLNVRAGFASLDQRGLIARAAILRPYIDVRRPGN